MEWFRGEWSDLGERGVVDPERLAETGHRKFQYNAQNAGTGHWQITVFVAWTIRTIVQSLDRFVPCCANDNFMLESTDSDSSSRLACC